MRTFTETGQEFVYTPRELTRRRTAVGAPPHRFRRTAARTAARIMSEHAAAVRGDASLRLEVPPPESRQTSRQQHRRDPVSTSTGVQLHLPARQLRDVAEGREVVHPAGERRARAR